MLSTRVKNKLLQDLYNRRVRRMLRNAPSVPTHRITPENVTRRALQNAPSPPTYKITPNMVTKRALRNAPPPPRRSNNLTFEQKFQYWHLKAQQQKSERERELNRKLKNLQRRLRR